MRPTAIPSIIATVGVCLASGCTAPSAQRGPAIETSGRAARLRIGDRIPERAFVYDSGMVRRELLDLIDRDASVVVLEIMAGAAVPGAIPDRGGLWCEDTYNDAPLANFLVHRYANDDRVQFLPVVVPPVYHGDFGYDRAAFMTTAGCDPRFIGEFDKFISATERVLSGSGKAAVIPYSHVYYDPRNRLLLNGRRADLLPGPGYGTLEGWEGCFKSPADGQTYGTPTIWLLSGDAVVLREPFFGNVYEGPPQQLNYTIRDVVAAIDSLLDRS